MSLDTEQTHAAPIDAPAWSAETEPAAKLNGPPKEAPPPVHPWHSVMLRAAGIVACSLLIAGGITQLVVQRADDQAQRVQSPQATQTVDVPPPVVDEPSVAQSMDDPDLVYPRAYAQSIDAWQLKNLPSAIQAARDLCAYMDVHPDPIAAGAADVQALYPKVNAHDARGFAIAAARAYCREDDQE